MSASRINSFDANFPVPTSSRDVNSRSAIFSFEGLSAIVSRINEFTQPCECRSPESTGWQPVRSPDAERAPLSRLYDAAIHVHSPRSMTQFDLRQQDCVKGMSRLPNEHVDLVVTSPPYNLGVDYKKYSDRQDRQSYLDGAENGPGKCDEFLSRTARFFSTSARRHPTRCCPMKS